MSCNTTWKASRFPWMSAMMANFMSLLSYNFKPAKFICRFAPDHLFVLNEALEPRVLDSLAKGLQLTFGSFGNEFHPAIRQIAHGAGDLESADHRLDRVAKTDTLHSSRVKNVHPCTLHGTCKALMCNTFMLPEEKSPIHRILTQTLNPKTTY